MNRVIKGPADFKISRLLYRRETIASVRSRENGLYLKKYKNSIKGLENIPFIIYTKKAVT